MTPPLAPNLIEAARSMFATITCAAQSDFDAETYERFNALGRAVDALPPDAVVVSAALLREAAHCINEPDSLEMRGPIIDALLQAAEGGKGGAT